MADKELVFVGTVDNVKFEDGKQAKIATIFADGEIGVFFRLQSWAEGGGADSHPVLDGLVKEGTRVQITMKVIE